MVETLLIGYLHGHLHAGNEPSLGHTVQIPFVVLNKIFEISPVESLPHIKTIATLA
jgi:hypothetical protein